jgi:TPR repeat protein
MKIRLWFIALASALSGSMSAADGPAYLWPDAPPVVLREELFGVRFRLVRYDKGPKAAEKFLHDAIQRGLTPEVIAYAAWTSLFSKAWGMEPVLSDGLSEPLLRRAIAEGSALAADVLGRAMILGQGVVRDEEQGLKLLDLAVERGSARAIARRGVYWTTGVGGRADLLRGAREVRRAAALGVSMGLVELAEGFESGSNGFAQNLPLALEHYYLVALENESVGWRKLEEFEGKGVPNARIMRSLAYVRFANEGGFLAPSVVRKHIAILEKEGHMDHRVLVELGLTRLFGVDWVKRDVLKAKEWLTIAQATNDEAKFFLAYMRLRGLAGPEEKEAALAEMTAMANGGNVRAAARLGYFYYWGSGEAGKLPKDPSKAFHYTRMAAENGSKLAVINLAHLYKHEIGTRANPVLAAKLYWIATEYGISGAKRELLSRTHAVEPEIAKRRTVWRR